MEMKLGEAFTFVVGCTKDCLQRGKTHYHCFTNHPCRRELESLLTYDASEPSLHPCIEMDMVGRKCYLFSYEREPLTAWRVEKIIGTWLWCSNAYGQCTFLRPHDVQFVKEEDDSQLPSWEICTSFHTCPKCHTFIRRDKNKYFRSREWETKDQVMHRCVCRICCNYLDHVDRMERYKEARKIMESECTIN